MISFTNHLAPSEKIPHSYRMDSTGSPELKTVVVIPAYNEAERIGPVVEAALKEVDTVIVTDDGSSDATAAVAKASGA